MISTADSKEDFIFLKNTILVVSFFIITPIAVSVSLIALYRLSHPVNITDQVHASSVTNINPASASSLSVYASLPSTVPSITAGVEVADARGIILKQYYQKYNSPLEPHAYQIVEIADKYSLDFRLTTAIAQQESNLCKKSPPGCNNCWGFGIHSRGTMCFDSYTEAVEEVSRWLKSEYIDKGYVTVDQIMSKYTPLSNGSWANGVKQFMLEMQ